MKYVWEFTVLYSGPIGLAGYWYAGRSQISHDSLCRRGFRSVSHCYSGCGAGEITGVVITGGVLALGNLSVALATFALAYVFGYAMTVGPLLQEGVGFQEAMIDTLFCSSLVFSLSMGLIAAYPVNVVLIEWDVKEGMMNPAEMSS